MPLIGVITAVMPFALFRYKKRWLMRFLTYGTPTQATIEKVKHDPKGSLVVELRYNVAGVELKSKTNTSGRKHEKEWLKSLHDTGRQVTILVDPKKPRSIFLLDLLINQGKGNRFGFGG